MKLNERGNFLEEFKDNVRMVMKGRPYLKHLSNIEQELVMTFTDINMTCPFLNVEQKKKVKLGWMDKQFAYKGSYRTQTNYYRNFCEGEQRVIECQIIQAYCEVVYDRG